MESKEREIHGEWMTEEKMNKCGEFSPTAGKITGYAFTSKHKPFCFYYLLLLQHAAYK